MSVSIFLSVSMSVSVRLSISLFICLSVCHHSLSGAAHSVQIDVDLFSPELQMEASRAEQELSLLRESKTHDHEESERLRATNASVSERVKALRQELVAANAAHMRVSRTIPCSSPPTCPSHAALSTPRPKLPFQVF